MRIGIDACFMTGQKTGIGLYILEVISALSNVDSEDQFVLYFNRPCGVSLDLPDNWTIREDDDTNFLIWQIFKLPKLIRQDDIDLFWEPANRMPVIPKGPKILLTVHDLSAYLERKYASVYTHILERLTFKRSCRKADMIISVSDYTARDMIRHFGIERNKIRVVHNPDPGDYSSFVPDEKTWDEIRQKYGIKMPYFLSIGTISHRKNSALILEAFNEYKRSGGNRQVVFAGRGASAYKEFMTAWKNSEYRDDIILTDYIDDEEKKYIFACADALIFPSRFEGFGFPVLEAFGYGIPVVTSRESSLPEIGSDAVMYLDDIDDVNGLARIMGSLGAMVISERNALIEKGNNRLKAFSKPEWALKTYGVLKELTGRQTGKPGKDQNHVV